MTAQRDLELPLLGHRQALLRAIAQLPMLAEAAGAEDSSPSPDRTATSPARCARPSNVQTMSKHHGCLDSWRYAIQAALTPCHTSPTAPLPATSVSTAHRPMEHLPQVLHLVSREDQIPQPPRLPCDCRASGQEASPGLCKSPDPPPPQPGVWPLSCCTWQTCLPCNTPLLLWKLILTI